MKNVTPALATLINSLPTGGSFVYCHIYTINLAFSQGGVSGQPYGVPAGDPSALMAWEEYGLPTIQNVSRGYGSNTVTTTANGAVASGNVLTLNSVTGMQVGDAVADVTTAGVIPANTTIQSINAGAKQITMTNSVAGGGVLNNDTIQTSRAGLGGRPLDILVRMAAGLGQGGEIRRGNAAVASQTPGQSAIRLTDGPIDIKWNGVVYSSNTIRIDQHGNKRLAHWKRGLDVDTTVVSLAPRTTDPITGASFPDKIGSVPFIEAARGGALDGADIQIDRAFFASWPQPYVTPVIPSGTITIFAGTPAEVDTSDSQVVLTVNDYRQLLQTKFPRVHFQLQCHHNLYDSGCTLNPSVFSVVGACAASSTRQVVVANAALTAPTNPGSGTFTLGKVAMTSGLNAGFSRTVRQWTAPNTFALLNPLPFAVATGDTFVASEGCDKQQSTCTAFNNLVNFGAESFIPDATTAA